MFSFGNQKKQNLNPFTGRKPIDIQPGVSPEIVDEIPYQNEEEGKSKGFFRNLFGYSNGNNNNNHNNSTTNVPSQSSSHSSSQPLPDASPSLQETYSHSLYEAVQTLSSRILPMGAASTGHLTAEEFIKAGNYLVEHNENWEWSFEPERMNINFPPDKQFLINRGLVCQSRIEQQPNERVHLDMRHNDLWTCPKKPSQRPQEAHIYDVSLTYDQTNRTPRVWLVGYSENGKPLSMEEVAKDINIEFVGTVATMIAHPFTNVLNVSIHPCRHAEGMSRIIDQVSQSRRVPFNQEEYMVYFLQLIACIFPTIHIA